MLWLGKALPALAARTRAPTTPTEVACFVARSGVRHPNLCELLHMGEGTVPRGNLSCFVARAEIYYRRVATRMREGPPSEGQTTHCRDPGRFLLCRLMPPKTRAQVGSAVRANWSWSTVYCTVPYPTAPIRRAPDAEATTRYSFSDPRLWLMEEPAGTRGAVGMKHKPRKPGACKQLETADRQFIQSRAGA